ncbi:MAG: PspC domain-containing protein [Candidatus Limnocylindria bacterium]
MTTEQPISPRILRRRADERVIGGVASGLGSFLNIDPLLIRIGFVGLMVFGGLGLLLYVGAWLLVPEEARDDSIVEQLLNRAGLTTQRFLIGVLLVIGGLMFVAGISTGIGYGLATGIGAAVVVIVVGAVLLRQGDWHVAVATPRAAASAQRVKPAADTTAPAAVRRRRRRARSPLGWYVLGAMLAGIGVLALATNVSGTDVDLGQFFGLALAVVGIGLVVGTWWGHARLLILLGILLLPFAITASFVTAPIEGGLGFHQFTPVNADEVGDEYRLIGGRMELDLTEIPAGGEPIEIVASVAVGQMYVALPENASVELDADVGGGELGVLGTWQDGSGLVDRYVRDGDGPRFILDLELGIGSLWVDGVVVEDR